MTEPRLPRPNPQVLFTELDDGTGVLLHLDTKFYFTLNRTGVTVWKELSSRPEGATPALVAQRIAELFDVSAEDAERDVLAIVETMASEGLIESA